MQCSLYTKKVDFAFGQYGKSLLNFEMASILNILNELSASLGYEAVRSACQKFSSSKSAPVADKVKKQYKPRGKSSWNLAVDKTLEEMRVDYLAKNPGSDAAKVITYKMAYAEASKNKRANDPAAQATYEKYRAKVEEKRAAKRAAKGDTAPAPTPVAQPPAPAHPAPAHPAAQPPAPAHPAPAQSPLEEQEVPKKRGRPAKAT